MTTDRFRIFERLAPEKVAVLSILCNDHLTLRKVLEARNVNSFNYWRHFSLLHIASALNPNLITTLIELGANVESRTENGSTPLHIAAEHGNFTSCQLLASYGADLNAKDLNFNTPGEGSESVEYSHEL